MDEEFMHSMGQECMKLGAKFLLMLVAYDWLTTCFLIQYLPNFCTKFMVLSRKPVSKMGIRGPSLSAQCEISLMDSSNDLFVAELPLSSQTTYPSCIMI